MYDLTRKHYIYANKTQSQRDVSLHIPINFVNQPGISVTAACFSHQQYISTAAARCISNLLAIGIRRLELDVYWDVSRRVWSLCPVESGGDKSSQNVTSSLPAQTVAMSTASLASGQLTGALARATSAIDLKYGAVVNRQDTSLNVISRSSSASSSSMTTTTLSMIANSTSMSLPLPTYQSGSYSCESSTSLELFVDVLSGYLSRTETNLNATIMTLILNVHAAAPQSASPTSASEPQSDDLPRDGELLSSILSTNMSIYTYTPNELDAQRVTLNSSGSWYSDSAYYETINNASPDGWPSESFVELRKAERLLVGFGRVDPQMLQYNFTGDNSVIFPSGYLQANPAVTLSSVAVDAGCLYQQGQFDVQNVNSSWAVAPLQANQISAAQQLIDCGISPSLNQSLDNITADQSWAPYRDYVLSTDWAWGAGEPRNATDDESDAGLLINMCCSECYKRSHASSRLRLIPSRWLPRSTSAVRVVIQRQRSILYRCVPRLRRRCVIRCSSHRPREDVLTSRVAESLGYS